MLYLYLLIRLYKNEFSTGFTGVEKGFFFLRLLYDMSYVCHMFVICYNGYGRLLTTHINFAKGAV